MDRTTYTDDKYTMEVYQRISDNLKYLMKKNNYSQLELCRQLDSRGLHFNQGNLSKILNHPQKNHISISCLIKCCDIFQVSMEEISLEDLSHPMHKEPRDTDSWFSTVQLENDGFTSSLSSRPFKGYKGKYYCYFFPTISSEPGILKGTMEISPDDAPDSVRFELTVTTVTKGITNTYLKIYTGKLIHSYHMHNCYCILKSGELSELCFFVFRHIGLNNKNLECRAAEVLTVSAGESKCPTVHRMFFSRDEIRDEDLKYVMPMMMQNSSNIIISKSDLNHLAEENSIPPSLIERLLTKVSPEEYYIIKEGLFRGLLSTEITDQDKEKIPLYISMIRERSFSYHYNKVSRKLDENLHSLLKYLGYF